MASKKRKQEQTKEEEEEEEEDMETKEDARQPSKPAKRATKSRDQTDDEDEEEEEERRNPTQRSKKAKEETNPREETDDEEEEEEEEEEEGRERKEKPQETKHKTQRKRPSTRSRPSGELVSGWEDKKRPSNTSRAFKEKAQRTMTPEQAREKAMRYKSKTDVYGMGDNEIFEHLSHLVLDKTIRKKNQHIPKDVYDKHHLIDDDFAQQHPASLNFHPNWPIFGTHQAHAHQIRIKKRDQRIGAHRLAAIAFHRRVQEKDVLESTPYSRYTYAECYDDHGLLMTPPQPPSVVKTLDASHVLILPPQDEHKAGKNFNPHHVVFESNQMNLTREFCKLLFYKGLEARLSIDDAADQAHLSCRELHSERPCMFYDADNHRVIRYYPFDRIRRCYKT